MTSLSFLIDSPIGDYDIRDCIGEGAFGTVFRGTHAPTATGVAVKVLRLGATLEEVREFENEAQLLARLTGSTNVVELLDSQKTSITIPTLRGQDVAVPIQFHVMELADQSLDYLLAYRDKIPWKERLLHYRNVVRGVHQMHLRDIVHRDLKASNCLLFSRPRHVVETKVSDLGRARDLTQASAAHPNTYSVGRGDPRFAPPEFIWRQGADQGQAHRCSDLYGLGSLLFEVATGQGLTGTALQPRQGVIAADLGLPPSRWPAQYRVRIPEIRSWFEVAFQILASELPPSIRPEALKLVRQLCDPDPGRRTPYTKTGKSAVPSNDLNWILRRLDILDRMLKTRPQGRQP